MCPCMREVGGTPAAAAAAAQDTPQLLQGDALASISGRALGTGCYASHMALVAGEPPATAGFEAPLVFAMQEPAPGAPKHTAAAAAAAAVSAPSIAAAATAAVAAPSIAARQLSSDGEGGGAAAASAGAMQGTKRK